MRLMIWVLAMMGLSGIAGCVAIEGGPGDGDTGTGPLPDYEPFGGTVPGELENDELGSTGGYFGLEPYGTDTGWIEEGIPAPGLF